jgi:hypothetical protein
MTTMITIAIKDVFFLFFINFFLNFLFFIQSLNKFGRQNKKIYPQYVSMNSQRGLGHVSYPPKKHNIKFQFLLYVNK